jgi:hypothetical protein
MYLFYIYIVLYDINIDLHNFTLAHLMLYMYTYINLDEH